MTTRDKLAAIRRLMNELDLHALVVPSADAHLSEYVPSVWQRRRWLTGFTGSAGDLVVTQRDAGLWTDARYFAQAEIELRGSGIRLRKMHTAGVPSLEEYLAGETAGGGKIGVDPQVVSRSRFEEIERALARRGDGKLVFTDRNLVDEVWTDRPRPSSEAIHVLALRFAGETLASKLRRVRKELAAARADAILVTALDDLAWLYNIRGSDIDFNPVAIAYGIVTPSSAALFTGPDKISPALRRAFGKHVEIHPYDDIGVACDELARARARVWADPATANMWLTRRLEGASIVSAPAPIARIKARKNPAEIAGMRAAHVRDGVAMVRFLEWLEKAVPRGGVTEISAAAELSRFRARGDHFQGASFRTISAYAAHGAIVHYTVTDETNVPLRPEGIYLVDSGGHYLDGTTDITRTVLLGKRATAVQKAQLTRVLKGVIALTTVVFPEGVRGLRLDTLARRALWEVGLDYGHGTGHGVGMYLNVHEGPQSIGVRCTSVPLEEGNIFSNEPGYYVEGEYGLRIENLILVRKEEALSKGGRTFFSFDTLTLCPIDTKLVDVKLLTAGERRWLNDYHRGVRRTLSPFLEASTRAWLTKACAAV
jgi:Xaa-Pro aminopeptidase